MPMEIFYPLQDENSKKWGNGILLQEYKGKFSLIRANKSRKGDDLVYPKWGFPQNGNSRQPVERAIPWKVELGDAREAVTALKFFLRQLSGDGAQQLPPEQPYGPIDQDIPF